MPKLKRDQFGNEYIATEETEETEFETPEFETEEITEETGTEYPAIEAPETAVTEEVAVNDPNDPPATPTPAPNDPAKKEYVPTPDEWLDIKGREYRIPRHLRHSIFQFESGKRQFKENGELVESHKKAQGYTQILKSTARSMGYENTDTNPYDNIAAGVKYLRQGFDIAKKKGYDDDTAWIMATRGYLNGHHEQEKNKTDKNLWTDDYEERVVGGWLRNQQSGEPEDDWNDPKYLTPYELEKMKASGVQIPTGEQEEDLNAPYVTLPSGEQVQTTPQTAEQAPQTKEEYDAAVQKNRDENYGRAWQYFRDKYSKDLDENGKELGEEGAKKLYYEATGGDTKVDIDPKKIDEFVFNHERKRIMSVEKQDELFSKLSPKQQEMFGQWLTAKNMTGVTAEAYDNWVLEYNQSIKNDPTKVRLQVPKQIVTGMKGQPISLHKEDPTEFKATADISGKDKMEVRGKLFARAGMATDPNDPAMKAGYEEFVRQSGLDLSGKSPEELQKIHGAYQKNLSKIRSASASGDVRTLNKQALKSIVELVRAGGVGELKKLENQWLHTFGLDSVALTTELEQSAPDVLDALQDDPIFGKKVSANRETVGNNQRIAEMIQRGEVPDAEGQGFASEVNVTEHFARSGNNHIAAGRSMFIEAAKGLGYTDKEIDIALQDNPDLALTRTRKGKGDVILSPEMVEGGEVVGGNVTTKYYLYSPALKALNKARKVDHFKFDSVNAYDDAMRNSWSNQHRRFGQELADKALEYQLGQFKEGNTITGTLAGGLAKTLGEGANEYIKATSGMMDLSSMIWNARMSPFDKGSKADKMSMKQLWDVHENALNITSAGKASREALTEYWKTTGNTQYIAGSLVEVPTFVLSQLPMYAVHAATGGYSAAVVNLGKNLHEGTPSDVIFGMASDIIGVKVAPAMSKVFAGSHTAEKVAGAIGRGLKSNSYLSRAANALKDRIPALASSERIAGMEKALKMMAGDPTKFMKQYEKFITIHTEELLQLPIPAMRAGMETVLSPEGRKMKDEYYRIKNGEVLYTEFLGKPKQGGGTYTMEDIQQMNRDTVTTYDGMTDAFTAKGFARDFLMAIAMPRLNRSMAKIDAAVIDNVKGEINLTGGRLYTRMVRGLDGVPEAEYSGEVILPSGKKEFMVIPKDHKLVAEKLKTKSVIPVRAEYVDTNLFLSRLANHASGTDYQKMVEADEQNAINLTRQMNPLMTEEAIQKTVADFTRRKMDEDTAAKQYIEQQKVNASELNKLMDEDLKTILGENQAKAEANAAKTAAKETASKERSSDLETINNAIKETTNPETQKALLAEASRLSQEEIASKKPETKKFEDGTDITEDVVNTSYKNVSEGKTSNRDVEAIVKDGDFANITAITNPETQSPRQARIDMDNLQKDLEAEGFNVVRGTGKYGNEEATMFVTDKGGAMTTARKKTLMDLSTKYDQHQVLIGQKGDYTAPVTKADRDDYKQMENYGSGKIDFNVKGDDYYTELDLPDGQKVRYTVPDLYDNSRKYSDARIPEGRNLKGEAEVRARFKKQGEAMVNSFKTPEEKAALAKMIGNREVLVAPDGMVVIAKKAKKHPSFAKFNFREKELRELNAKADALATRIDPFGDAEYEASKKAKAEKGSKTSKTEENGSEGSSSPKEGVSESESLVGKQVKYKSDGRAVEVASETEKSVTDTKGNIISKKLLDLPKVKKSEAKSEKVAETSDEPLTKEGKINTNSKEFAPDNPTSVGRQATDNTLLINDAFANALKIALDLRDVEGSITDGFNLTPEQAVEAIRVLRKGEGAFDKEIGILTKALANRENPLADLNILFARDKKLVFTSLHEYVHTGFKKIFGNKFNEQYVTAMQGTKAFSAMENTLKKMYGVDELAPETVIHEIFAYGLVGDHYNLGVKPKMLADALDEAMELLQQQYGDLKVTQAIDIVFKNVDALEAAVGVDSATVAKGKQVVTTELEKRGVKYAGNENQAQTNKEIRQQGIIDSAKAESFVITGDETNQGQKGNETADRQADGNSETGLRSTSKTIPTETSYDSKDSPLYQERTMELTDEAEVRALLEKDGASRKILRKGITVKDGTRVGVRLNLNIQRTTGKLIQALHLKDAEGRVQNYQEAVTVRNVEFYVNQNAREKIATKQENKFPMASVNGDFDASNSHSFDGLEVSFNPMREHLFVDSTGRPIKRADEATVLGRRVYVRGNVEYWTPEDMPEYKSPSAANPNAPFTLPEPKVLLSKSRNSKPLSLSEKIGGWTPKNILSQLKEDDGFTQKELESVRREVESLRDTMPDGTPYSERNSILLKPIAALIESKGFDGIDYLNRTREIDTAINPYKTSVDIDVMDDDDFAATYTNAKRTGFSIKNGEFDLANSPTALLKVRTDTPEFQEFIGNSKVQEVVYHGTRSDIDSFSHHRISPSNFGFHVGTAKQANHFTLERKPDGTVTRKAAEGANVIPLYVKAENPIRLTDLGSWGANSVINQLKFNKDLEGKFDVGELKDLQTRVNALNKGLGIFATSDQKKDMYKQQNALVREFLTDRGYDSIEYVNRYEGLDGVNEATIHDARTRGDDSLFESKYKAEKSYILFSPVQLKSAIGNNGKFSQVNMNILFHKKQNEPESHDLQIMRLTPNGDPFTFTNKAGAEHREALATKADPVFNFFVKGGKDYEFEQEFGRDGKPHASLKAFETKGNFKLFDVYTDTTRMFAEYGRATAIRKLKEMGYDGFHNTNPDMASVYRNRVSLFDTPLNRVKILHGTTGERGDIDTRIMRVIEQTNLELPDTIKREVYRNNPITQLAEDMNVPFLRHTATNAIEFENDSDADIVSDYMNHPDVSLNTIAKAYDTTIRQVTKAIKKYGVPIYETVGGRKQKTLSPKDLKLAIKLHTSDDMRTYESLTKLGRRFKMDKETIGRILRDAGVKTNDAQTSQQKSARVTYRSVKGRNVRYNSPVGKSEGSINKVESSYELAYMTKLDGDDNVITWTRDAGKIPYTYEGKKRHYFPDFIVNMADGKNLLVEVKPQYMVDNSVVKAKSAVAEKWAKENNHEYVIVNEESIGIEAFENIDLDRVTGSPDDLGVIGRGSKGGARVAKAMITLRNAQTDKPNTPEKVKQHKRAVNTALYSMAKTKEVVLSEPQAKETERWLQNEITKPKTGQKYDSRLLVIPEGVADGIVAKQNSSKDFVSEDLLKLAKLHPDIDGQLPHSFRSDAELLEVFARGIAGKDWYENSYNILVSMLDNSIGKFIPETFVRLIGALGQGTSPLVNFHFALKYMNRVMGGTYKTDGDIQAEVQRLKDNGLLNGDGRYDISIKNIADAMKHQDLETRKLGDYTLSFLGQNPEIVTGDEWMCRLFTGKSSAPHDRVYDYIEGRTRHIAKMMGVTPVQAQAILWVGYKQIVAEHIDNQQIKARELGLDETAISNLNTAKQAMLNGQDFQDIMEKMGLRGATFPEFPVAAVIAKHKDALSKIVKGSVFPKVFLPTPKKPNPVDDSANYKLADGELVGYYYNEHLKNNLVFLVDNKGLQDWLTNNPEVASDMSELYKSVYLRPEKSPYADQDLGQNAHLIARAAYLMERGNDLTSPNVKLDDVGILNKGKIKKLGLFHTTRTPESEEIYFSTAKQIVDQKMPNKASAAQIENILTNSGARAGELEWMGMKTFLASKDKFTKEEVQDFIAQNQVEVREVWKEMDDAPKQYELYDEDGDFAGATYDREEALRYVQQNAGAHFDVPENRNSNAVKFDEYRLEGEKKNYREVLLVAPSKPPASGEFNTVQFTRAIMSGEKSVKDAINELVNVVGMKYGTAKQAVEEIADPTRTERKDALRNIGQSVSMKYSRDLADTTYRGSHWDEQNVVSHFRFDERTTVDGKRTMHIAEIQSDWHQAGRKKGYKDTPYVPMTELPEGYEYKHAGYEGASWNIINPEGLYFSIGKTKEEALGVALEKLNYKAKEEFNEGKVANAPFKKAAWHEMTFRRALKYAVDNGYDSISWNTGEQNAEIFSLRRTVESIEFKNFDENYKSVTVNAKEFNQVIRLSTDRKTGIVNSMRDEFDGKHISEIVGDEIADKILTQDTGFIDGDGLVIGTKGMKGFYDKILPDYARKFIKSFKGADGKPTAQLTTAELVTDKLEYNEIDIGTMKQKEGIIRDSFASGGGVFVEMNEGVKTRVNNLDLALAHLREGEKMFFTFDNADKVETVHRIDITPEMRDGIYQKPVALFKKSKDETAQIKALQGFNYGDWIDLATDIAGNGVITQKEAQDIQDLVSARDLKGLQKYVGNLNREGILGFLASFRRANMLTAIGTSARNIVGNTSFQALEELTRIPASIVDIAFSLPSGQPRTVQGLSPVGIGRGLYKAATEGLKKAGTTMLKGDNYFSQDDMHINREKTTGYTVLKPFEMARNLVYRGLGAQDNIFRTYAEERAKYEIAKLKAKNNGTDTATEYANLDITDLDKAQYAASVAVFANDNGVNTVYQNYRGKTTEPVRFMLDLMLPFVKTPTNIFERILDYSGISGVYKLANSDRENILNVFKDTETRRAFLFAISKGMTGWALMALGYGLADAGLMYGFRDQDDQALNKVIEEENAGNGHILIGGKWRDISSISPIATMMQMGATYHRMKQKQAQATEDENKGLADRAVSITKILLQIAQQSPFLKAGAETLNERTAGAAFSADKMLPLDTFVPAIVNEIAQTMDDKKRSVTSGEGVFDKIIDKTKSKIPYLRETLPETKNALGASREQPAGYDMFRSKTSTRNEVTEEAKRLDYNMPAPKRKEGETQADFNIRKKESGDIVKDVLSQIVADPIYKEAGNKQKKEMLQVTSAVKEPDWTPEQRTHNIKANLLKVTIEKDLDAFLAQKGLTDEERKSMLTSFFNRIKVSKERTIEEARASFKLLLNTDPKKIMEERLKLKRQAEKTKAENALENKGEAKEPEDDERTYKF